MTRALVSPAEPAAASTLVAIDASTGTVRVALTLCDADVARFFEEAPEPLRPDLAMRALKVGALALRGARIDAKTDYVQREFLRMQADFASQMDRWFGERGEVTLRLHETFGDHGHVERRMQAFFGDGGRFESLMSEFAGEDGALAKALRDAVGDQGSLPRTMEEFLGEEGKLRRELDREFGEDGGRLYRILNPEDASTPLGQFRVRLEERFDPRREGSALWELKHDLHAQIEALRRDLGVKDAVAQEREKGHEKGFDFEHHVADLLGGIAAPHGDRVEHVAREKGPLGDVGDLVCALDPDTTAGLERRIVVEAKDRNVALTGKSSILKELDAAMQNRDAQFAIAVVEAEHASAFAPLRYIAPHYLLVAVDKDNDDALPLRVAYTLARALVAARAARREAQVDVEGLLAGLDEVRKQLESIQAMKTNLTGAVRSIEGVKGLLDDLRSGVVASVDGLAAQVRAAEA